MLVWKWEIVKNGVTFSFGRTHTKMDAFKTAQADLGRAVYSETLNDSYVVSIMFDDQEETVQPKASKGLAESGSAGHNQSFKQLPFVID